MTAPVAPVATSSIVPPLASDWLPCRTYGARRTEVKPPCAPSVRSVTAQSQVITKTADLAMYGHPAADPRDPRPRTARRRRAGVGGLLARRGPGRVERARSGPGLE